MNPAYFLREALRQAWRQRLLSLLAVASLALAALFGGAWALLWRNSQHWTESLVQAEQLAVYLRPGLPEAAQQAALQAARGLSGVAAAELVSPEQAAAELARDPEVKEALALLAENPLPPTLKVRLSAGQPIDVPAAAARLKALENVEEVDSGEGAVEGMLKASKALRSALLGLMALFSLAAGLVVGAVLRLAAWSRRRELGIMRLVGAGAAFVRAPFLLEGLLQGALGGALAAGALAGLLAWLQERLQSDLQLDLGSFLPAGLDWSLGAALVLATALLGLAGATLSLASVRAAAEGEDAE